MRARFWLAATVAALAVIFVWMLWWTASGASAPEVEIEIGTALTCELQDDGSIHCVELDEEGEIVKEWTE